MAVTVADITRDQVAEWLKAYTGQLRPTKKLRDYLDQKIQDAGVTDPQVDTGERDGLGKETHVADMILEDLDSYAS